jgi:hypothetical protein
MATSRDHRLAEEIWPQLVERAQREGVQWRVLNKARLTTLGARVNEYGAQYGAVVLLIALEGYIARCRDWAAFHRHCTPESIYRPRNMARNIEAGLEALEDRKALNALMQKSPHATEEGAELEELVF